VPAHARQLAAQLSALFDCDMEIVTRLDDAQRQLASANEHLWSGLAPDAFGLTLHDDNAAAIGQSPIATLIRDGGPAADSPMLQALKQARWQIHRASKRRQHLTNAANTLKAMDSPGQQKERCSSRHPPATNVCQEQLPGERSSETTWPPPP
jgi:hypothetical protein